MLRFALLLLVIFSFAVLASPAAVAPTNGIQTYYEESGQGEPVVFIHGFSLDHRIWQDQMEFAKNCRVVVYDVRGHGRSPADPPWTSADQVTDLLALLDHLKIQRANLVGLSMGGGIAVNFALAHPERVKSLVLAAPGIEGYMFAPEFIQRWFKLLEIYHTKGAQAFRDAALAEWTFDGVRRYPEKFALVKTMLQDFPTKTLDNPYTPPTGLTPLARLSEIHAPTLIMVGELDNSDIRAIADLARERIPGARKTVFRDCEIGRASCRERVYVLV